MQDHRLEVRLSETELAALDAARGLATRSAYVRHLILTTQPVSQSTRSTPTAAQPAPKVGREHDWKPSAGGFRCANCHWRKNAPGQPTYCSP